VFCQNDNHFPCLKVSEINRPLTRRVKIFHNFTHDHLITHKPHTVKITFLSLHSPPQFSAGGGGVGWEKGVVKVVLRTPR